MADAGRDELEGTGPGDRAEGGDVSPTSPGFSDEPDGPFPQKLFSKTKKEKGGDKPDAANIPGRSPGTYLDISSGVMAVTDTLLGLPTSLASLHTSYIPKVDLRREYDLSKKKLGKAFVFVNKHFDERTQLNMRKGAENDLVLYRNAFNHLGFEVIPYMDATADFIWRTVHDYSKQDHGDESCVVFAFSTHGNEEALNKKRRGQAFGKRWSGASFSEKEVLTDVIYARDEVIFTKNLLEQLSDTNCPSMAGKPKLFFFQACRGKMLDELLTTDGENVTVIKGHSSYGQKMVADVPLRKDFFIAYSAPPGYFSFRRSAAKNPDEVGSWFVMALYEAIINYGFELDLMDLMTLVTNAVAHDPKYQAKVADAFYRGRRIVPYISSMLLKTVRFRKG